MEIRQHYISRHLMVVVGCESISLAWREGTQSSCTTDTGKSGGLISLTKERTNLSLIYDFFDRFLPVSFAFILSPSSSPILSSCSPSSLENLNH